MARKKYSNNRKRKDMYLKTKGKGYNVSMPLGTKYKFCTRYVDYQVAIDPTTGGVPASYVFSLNGMYDPDITGLGHQPLGFDQLVGTMYNHYTVIGARARVTGYNNDTSTGQILILQIKDTNAISTDVENILENGQSRWCTLAPKGSGPCVKTLSINCSPSKFFGRDVMSSTTYQGTASSNPSDGVFLHITAQPVSNADTLSLRCTVVIEYIAMLTEPRQLGSS